MADSPLHKPRADSEYLHRLVDQLAQESMQVIARVLEGQIRLQEQPFAAMSPADHGPDNAIGASAEAAKAFTPKQAAKVLGISYSSMLNLMAAKKIAVLRHGPKLLRITAEAIDEYKNRHVVPASKPQRPRLYLKK
jgi:excisionase family DNA binding protein